MLARPMTANKPAASSTRARPGLALRIINASAPRAPAHSGARPGCGMGARLTPQFLGANAPAPARGQHAATMPHRDAGALCKEMPDHIISAFLAAGAVMLVTGSTTPPVDLQAPPPPVVVAQQAAQAAAPLAQQQAMFEAPAGMPGLDVAIPMPATISAEQASTALTSSSAGAVVEVHSPEELAQAETLCRELGRVFVTIDQLTCVENDYKADRFNEIYHYRLGYLGAHMAAGSSAVYVIAHIPLTKIPATGANSSAYRDEPYKHTVEYAGAWQHHRVPHFFGRCLPYVTSHRPGCPDRLYTDGRLRLSRSMLAGCDDVPAERVPQLRAQLQALNASFDAWVAARMPSLQ